MSTKIYHGFEIKSNNSVDLLSKLKTISKRIEKLADAKLKSWLAQRATYIFDNYTIENKDTSNGILVKVFMEYIDRAGEVKKTQKRDPGIDFSFSLTIFPKTAKKSIGIIYCEHQDLIDAFMDHEDVSDFSYWNNTDRPEDISESEWQARKKSWDKALDRTTFGKSGFTFTIIDDLFPSLNKAEYEEFAPEFDVRCKDACLDGCYQTYMTKLVDEHGTLENANNSMGGGASIYFEFKDWMQKTEEGQTAYQAAHEYCKDNLKEEISFEDL